MRKVRNSLLLIKEALFQTHLTSKYLDSDVPVVLQQNPSSQSPMVAKLYHHTIPKPFEKHCSEQCQRYLLCTIQWLRHKTRLFHPKSKNVIEQFHKVKFMHTTSG